jgi:3-oxoacyl-[acyl-carrier-protein] synthase III
MVSSYINYIDYHKPCYKLTVAEVLECVDDIEKNKLYISKYSNFDEIAIELRYNQFEMYDEMMEKYFLSNNPNDINFLIFTGRNYFVNNSMSVPHYLIGKYKMKNASLICLNQSCSGTPQGINLANQLLKANPVAKVMIVSLSKYRNIEERYGWPVINGDAAGMMVIASKGNIKILDCNAYSDGNLSVERCRKNEGNLKIDDAKKANYLKKIVLSTLEKNKVNIEDIQKFIVQNLHYFFHKLNAESININIEKLFLENIPRGAHLGDVDSIINIKDVISRYNKAKGSKYLLFTTGSLAGNITYNTVLMESC